MSDRAPPCPPRDATPPALVLGSGSPYRRELLQRLGLPFTCRSPGVDERPEPGERPEDLARRLAQAKAQAVAALHAGEDVVVIGSDQVAELNGEPLGKPGHHDAAVAQLQAMQGRTVLFHTALTVVRTGTAWQRSHLSTVTVRVRPLSAADIEAYLRRDEPYDCAGSAKVEQLGVALLDEVISDDPTALIGLPLIALCRMLRDVGLDPLHTHPAPPLPATATAPASH